MSPAQTTWQGTRWRGRRVAIVLSGVAPGSREHVMFELANRLAMEGAKVDLVMPSSGPVMAGDRKIPASVVDISSPLTRPFSNMLRLTFSPPSIAAYLRSTKPDVVLTLSIPPGLATLMARRLAGTTTPIVLRQSNVVRIEGSAIYGRVPRRLRDRLIPRLYPKAAAVIAVSEGVADNLRQILPPSAPPIHAIANGVPIDRIERLARAPSSHPWLRDRSTPLLVAVGRLVEQKDYPTLLSAFARLRAERPARLIIIGEGTRRADLERLRKALGLEAVVDLPGRDDNPFSYLARASLFISASRFEGMPNALIEALACGCPVVSTDCPSGPAEILDGGRFGRLVPIGDVEALASSMQAVLEAPPPSLRQRERALDFSADLTIERYLKVLDDVCEVKGKPRYSAAIA